VQALVAAEKLEWVIEKATEWAQRAS